MEKKVENNLLLDFYSGVLTPHQREILGLYYNLDISLSEIAAKLGLSRQAVYDAVKTGEKVLSELEEKLSCVKRYLTNLESLKSCESKLEKLEKKYSDNLIKEVRAEIEKIRKNQ